MCVAGHRACLRATSYQQVPHSPGLMTPLLARAQTTQITRISAAGIRREVETLRGENTTPHSFQPRTCAEVLTILANNLLSTAI